VVGRTNLAADQARYWNALLQQALDGGSGCSPAAEAASDHFSTIDEDRVYLACLRTDPARWTALLVVATTTALTAGALSTGVAHGAPSVATAAPQATRRAGGRRGDQEEKSTRSARWGSTSTTPGWCCATATSSSRSSQTPTPRASRWSRTPRSSPIGTVTRPRPCSSAPASTTLAQRDRDNWARAKVERDLARKLKQSAASVIAMPVTDEQLDLGYKDFVYKIWQFTATSRTASVQRRGAGRVRRRRRRPEDLLESGLLPPSGWTRTTPSRRPKTPATRRRRGWPPGGQDQTPPRWCCCRWTTPC